MYFLALLFHIGVLLCVVIPIRHAESALYRLGDVVIAVLRVLARAKIEKRVDADAVQVCDLLQHILSIFHCLDFLEFLRQRHCARCFDRLFVHSARVIVTDFPCLRRKLRVNRRLRRLFRDGVQRVIIAFNQLVERTPSRIFGRISVFLIQLPLA